MSVTLKFDLKAKCHILMLSNPFVEFVNTRPCVELSIGQAFCVEVHDDLDL